MWFQVSEDKLSAYIIKKEGDAPKIKSTDVINWLASAGIKYGLRKEKEIQKIIDTNITKLLREKYLAISTGSKTLAITI